MNPFKEMTYLKEFSEFINTASEPVPEALSQAIVSTTRRQFLWQKAYVFAKLLGIHTIMSSLSLYVCHQFDMNPFGSRFSLSDYFMAFGHSTCMIFCGFLFLGGSFLVARAVLKENDFSIIRRSYPLQIFILCSLSLGAFMALGAHLTFGMAALWVTGAYLGSAMSLLKIHY